MYFKNFISPEIVGKDIYNAFAKNQPHILKKLFVTQQDVNWIVYNAKLSMNNQIPQGFEEEMKASINNFKELQNSILVQMEQIHKFLAAAKFSYQRTDFLIKKNKGLIKGNLHIYFADDIGHTFYFEINKCLYSDRTWLISPSIKIQKG